MSKQFPNKRRKNSIVYNCDIIGGDNVNLKHFNSLIVHGNLCLGDKATLDTVCVRESIFLGNEATATKIKCNNEVYVGKSSNIEAIICTGSLTIDEHSTVGKIVCSKNLYLAPNVSVDTIVCYGNIYIANNSNIHEIRCTGNVFIDYKSKVGHFIRCNGSLICRHGCTIMGDIISESHVILEENCSAQDITSNGRISLSNNVESDNLIATDNIFLGLGSKCLNANSKKGIFTCKDNCTGVCIKAEDYEIGKNCNFKKIYSKILYML